MHHLNTYSLVTLLSAAVIFVMGICLIAVSVPKEAELSNYRLSRRFLAAAYMFLAGMQFAGVFFDEQMHLNTIIPCFQAMMFTFALITLINHRFITQKRLGFQLLLMVVITVIVLVNIYVLPRPSRLLFWIVNASYFCLFVYYVWIFCREYRNYKRRAENFYSGDEHKRLRWVVEVFIMAAVIGAVAGILEDNSVYFLIFITAYTLLYAYMVIRYINYVYMFHRMAPVVYVPVSEDQGREPKSEDIHQAVGNWIEKKRFLCADITLDTLARELSTNQFYLSRYINSEYGQNFRSWINSLRISEAMELMEQDRNLSLSEIAERIGVASISTFYRQFSAVAGMTPQEYRKQIRKNDKKS